MPSCGSLHLLRLSGEPRILQTAVEILALDSTHCDALGEVLLENEEDDDDRNCRQCRACHDQTKVGAVLCLQLCNAQRDGQVAGAGQHDQLHEVVIPAVDEGEDRQRTDARLDHRKHDADKGTCFACTVDTGCFDHLGGDALTELLHQEDAERPADDGENDRPDGVVQVERRHLTQQGNQNDLLGQSHCADDKGEQQLAADETLLCQSVTCHCRSDAGQNHGHNGHEDGVHHPADRRRNGGADREVDGVARGTERRAERDRQLPERRALTGKQLLIVRQNPLMRPPFGGRRVDGCTGLEGTGDDPVQREREQYGHDTDQDEGQDHVRAHSLELAGVPL